MYRASGGDGGLRERKRVSTCSEVAVCRDVQREAKWEVGDPVPDRGHSELIVTAEDNRMIKGRKEQGSTY